MTLTHPILRSFKNTALAVLLEDNTNSTVKWTENHDKILDLLKALESIFEHSLLPRKRIMKILPFQIDDTTYWNFIEDVRREIQQSNSEKRRYSLCQCIMEVSNEMKTKTSLARGRCFLRLCLKRNLLVHLLEIIPEYTFLINRWYDKSNSLFVDNFIIEIMRSIAMQLNQIKFEFEDANICFLDKCWLQPDYINEQIVPCRRMGINIEFRDNFAVIRRIFDGSVVAEKKNIIETGDIIDRINSHSIYNFSPNRLTHLLQHCYSRPINLFIMKRKDKFNNIYSPIQRLSNFTMKRQLLAPMTERSQSVDNNEDYVKLMEDLQLIKEKKMEMNNVDEESEIAEKKILNIGSVVSTGIELTSEITTKSTIKDDNGKFIPLHGLDPDSVDDGEQLPVNFSRDFITYDVFWLANVSIGHYGGTETIEHAIKRAKTYSENNKLCEATLKIEETGVTINVSYNFDCETTPNSMKESKESFEYDKESKESFEYDKELISSSTSSISSSSSSSSSSTSTTSKMFVINLSYTKISSCGRRSDNLEYFCIVAGETTCTLAQHFTAYVFKAIDERQSRYILNAIAQGFNRTHWLM